MASFSGCAPELIDSILQHLSFRDLLAVSIVSKRLHKCVTPLLYSQIDMTVHRDNPRSIIHLCRSIFNRPELAAHVDAVRLRDSECFSRWTHFSMNKPPEASPPRPNDEDGMSKFVPFISRSGLAYADIWTEKLRSGDLNAFVALFLSRLPRIKSFRVGNMVVLPDHEKKQQGRDAPTEARDMENQFLGKVFQSAVFDSSNHGISRFRHLQHISYPWLLNPWPGKNPDFCKPKDMMALLSLPSVRSISGWCLNPESLPFSWPTGPPELAYLTSLSLIHVRHDFLGQILERTRVLKKLRWVWSHTPYLDPLNTDILDLDRLTGALLVVQNTLEDLVISTDAGPTWDDPDFQDIDICGSLNGLRNMVNIKRFKVPFALLLSDVYNPSDSYTGRLEDSIPPNVEVVTFSDNYTGFNQGFGSRLHEWPKIASWLLETAWKTTPCLKEVCMFLKPYSPRGPSHELHKLEEIFEGTDVLYNIKHESKDSQRWD
ncbi:uncharacterized protein CC84DRAFT_1164522 [Paraphaeosphaeria sporulosa]|uniref:F-box domain-containing protein n=1 Tax=Paraphaeosphaeria sporulosa TaxID=1460663 RepID=A0A177CFV7_9PLEO|nr:uncharacterized protein CC84DRAFT_1164522 [Paraphaeosphaeria sporulosa]OAG06206.1 hypothetical protein CC84DRAFT_1164522 [Paraphaeosphaeria sporulosa]